MTSLDPFSLHYMEQQDIRILFLGTAPFAAQHLTFLVEAGYSVVGVVTAPDRPAGRGHKLQPSSVKVEALRLGLPIWQPERLRDESFLAEMRALRPTLGVVIAFRMLPEELWAMPDLGTLNIHASLLPRWRGAAPINHALMAGDKETGVSLFRLTKGLDEGQVLGQRTLPIEENTLFGDLYDSLAEEGILLLGDFLQACREGKVPEGVPQPEGANEPYAHKLTKENTRIDWNRSAREIHNFVRGLSPVPTAWTTLVSPNHGEPLTYKLFVTRVVSEEPLPKGTAPGTVLPSPRRSLHVATGGGILAIEELQAPAKKRLPIAAFLNGVQLGEGALFE